jgi:hypothetical protein
MKYNIELNTESGYYRIGRLLNKIEGYVPEGTCLTINGFIINKNGKILQKGKLKFSKQDNKKMRFIIESNKIGER